MALTKRAAVSITVTLASDSGLLTICGSTPGTCAEANPVPNEKNKKQRLKVFNFPLLFAHNPRKSRFEKRLAPASHGKDEQHERHPQTPPRTSRLSLDAGWEPLQLDK